LSVMAEIIAEPLVRDHLSKMHENNQTFLDQPFWIASVGPQQGPMRVFPSDIAQDAQVIIKIVTDKDFRPQRNKDLLQFLQTVTSIRTANPQLGLVNLLPFIGEFARSIGIDPKTVFLGPPPPMPMMGQGTPPGPGGPAQPGQGNAMDQIGNSLATAESMRSNAGELGAASKGQSMVSMAGAAP
jgi:hypothetical protein